MWPGGPDILMLFVAGSGNNVRRRDDIFRAKHQNFLPGHLQGGWLGLLFLFPLQAGGRDGCPHPHTLQRDLAGGQGGGRCSRRKLSHGSCPRGQKDIANPIGQDGGLGLSLSGVPLRKAQGLPLVRLRQGGAKRLTIPPGEAGSVCGPPLCFPDEVGTGPCAQGRWVRRG